MLTEKFLSADQQLPQINSSADVSIPNETKTTNSNVSVIPGSGEALPIMANSLLPFSSSMMAPPQVSFPLGMSPDYMNAMALASTAPFMNMGFGGFPFDMQQMAALQFMYRLPYPYALSAAAMATSPFMSHRAHPATESRKPRKYVRSGLFRKDSYGRFIHAAAERAGRWKDPADDSQKPRQQSSIALKPHKLSKIAKEKSDPSAKQDVPSSQQESTINTSASCQSSKLYSSSPASAGQIPCAVSLPSIQTPEVRQFSTMPVSNTTSVSALHLLQQAASSLDNSSLDSSSSSSSSSAPSPSFTTTSVCSSSSFSSFLPPQPAGNVSQQYGANIMSPALNFAKQVRPDVNSNSVTSIQQLWQIPSEPKVQALANSLLTPSLSVTLSSPQISLEIQDTERASALCVESEEIVSPSSKRLKLEEANS